MAVEKKYVETPLMKQYYDFKAKHPDAILLFRVGDFYETFGDDAIKASSILGITLTKRANGSASSVELAGFPHHAIDTYLPKLVRAGERVAICEQLEDPKLAKGLVKRGVIELVTPGVVLGDNVMTAKENTFLAAVYFGKRTAVAFLDISTGEFYVAEGDDRYIDKLLAAFAPKEVLYQRSMADRFQDTFGSRFYTYRLDDWIFSSELNYDKLCKQFSTPSLKGFGVETMADGIAAAGAILYYLEFTEHRSISHIASISRIDNDESVWIDKFTIRNLELFPQGDGGKRSFVEVVDRTLTPMGGRMLRRWVAMPLRVKERIERRHDVVEAILKDNDVAEALRHEIASIGDVERMASRIAAGRILPRELVQLKSSLTAMEMLKALLDSTSSEALHAISAQIDPLTELRDMLATTIYPDPANNQIQKGGVIADGVSAELDDLRRVALHGKEVLQQILERESEATGIPSLKISFNNVFGYYIEVRNTHKDKVPETWIRKQ
ncbi:MAG: DNA mismatch repair protein MutS, partial [Alistipes sp.]|nr:DNA mismatch repair protein MutS [Alistipes sp.]